jgi:hypothetical protein
MRRQPGEEKTMTVDSEANDEAYMKLVWRADPIVRECIVKLRQTGLTDVHIARVLRDASKVLETAGG